MKKNGFAPLLLIFVVAGLVVGFFLLGNEFAKKFNLPTTGSIKTAPTFTPLPTFNPSNGRLYYDTVIYSTNNNGSEKILTKKIYPGKYAGMVTPVIGGGKIYYVSDDNVFEYDMNTKTSKEVYTVTGGFMMSFIEYSSPNYLYITEGNADFDTSGKLELTIKKLDLTSGSISVIGSREPVLYGNLQYIGKADRGNIIGTFGGDGCGGYGSIYKVENGSYNLIKKTGGGCITDPRFIGYSENLSSLITVTSIGKNETDQKDEFIYLTNVITGENKAIFDLTKLNDTFRTYIKSKDKDVVYLVGTKKIYTLDLNSQTITSQSDLTADFTNFYAEYISGDTKDAVLFVYETNSPSTQKFTLVDPVNGQVLNTYQSPAEKDAISGSYRSVNVFGLFNNNLFSLSYSSPQYE